MACTCLERVSEKLGEKFGGEVHYSNTVETMNFKTGEVSTSLEPLRFTYPNMKKDGTPSKSRGKSFVLFTYCPFCGKKYDETEATA